MITSRKIKRQVAKNTSKTRSIQPSRIFRRKLGKSKVAGDLVLYRAACTADAGSGSTIAATLFNTDGTTGTAITVTCNISNGTALNEATPKLESGDPIYVKSIFWDD
ncbi:MAG: hypothetical protein DRP42_07430, partial [Tenericutes bacterium]